MFCSVLVLSVHDSSHGEGYVFHCTLTCTVVFPDDRVSPLIARFNYLHLQNQHSTAACDFIAIVISFWLFFFLRSAYVSELILAVINHEPQDWVTIFR